MEIKVLKKEKDKVVFLISGTVPAFVNGLRRIIVNDVPTMAIEDVNFLTNSSALYDEMLAHRLGLVPMKTDLKSYNLPSECKCKDEGCSLCQLHLKLKKKGPGIVYSEDLKSQDPKVKPVFGKMVIAKLLEGQELELEATAVLGTGKEHMKFSPGLIYYKGVPLISKKESGLKDIPLKKYGKFETIDESKCDILKAYAKIDAECEKVEFSSEDFIFIVESWGQLDAKNIINQAVKVFDAKLKKFESGVKKLK